MSLLVFGAPAQALTEAQIDGHLEYAEYSANNVDRQSYAMFVVATKYPKGSFARAFWLGASGAPYVFGVQRCSQWVANYAIAARMNGHDIDRRVIDNQCLGKETLRVIVSPATRANAMVSAAFGFIPLPDTPITAVRIELDGELIPPLPDELYDMPSVTKISPRRLRDAKRVFIVATVGSQYHLRVKIKPKMIASILTDFNRQD